MAVDLLRCALPAAPRPDLGEAIQRPFLRDAALEALASARRHPQRAGPELSRWFRATRRLGSRDRRIVGEAVHGVLRHEGLLRRAGSADDAELVQGWAALEQGARFDDLPATEPTTDYAAALSLPQAIAAEWLAALGETEAAALGAALGGRAPVTLRANRVRCTRAALAARLADEGVPTAPADTPDGLHVLQRAHFPSLSSFRDGWFEVQDEASQMLCEAIPLQPGQVVVDLCAGAGGKSLALAARGARVVAHDVRGAALDELRRRSQRAGASVEVGAPRKADVVLVDAPCSGTGRLRRDPALRLGLPTLALKPLLQTQADLIRQAGALVRPGGYLVYATCSLLAAENDPPAPEAGHWTLHEARLLWPHDGGTDGFGWRTWRRA